MARVHLLTFGGGGPRYRRAGQRLVNQALASGLFDAASAVTDLDLKNDVSFTSRHGEFVENHRRGYGYWLWKPYIISRTMSRLSDGDILFYCDAGCEFNRFGKDVFLEYLRMIRENELLFFEINHLNETWSKGDLLIKYPNMIGRKMVMGGVIGILVGDLGKNIVSDWYNLCSSENYHLIDDGASVAKNAPSFVENRHDQSCLNAILSKYSETFKFSIAEIHEGIHFESPIIISRNKGGLPRILTLSVAGYDVFVFKHGRYSLHIEARKSIRNRT